MRCARTTPPPPKLTVRATLRGNVSTAHASVAAGSAPESAAARSLTSTGLSIGSAAQVAQLEQAIDHPDRARGHVVTLRVDHQLRRERLLVGVRNAGELGDLARQRAGVQALGVAAHTLLERRLYVHLDRHGARERGLAGPRQTGEPERESARLREAWSGRQLGLSHCSALSSPLSAWRRGGRG